MGADFEASTFDKRHNGALVVVGSAPSLAKMDLAPLDRFVTIGCNGILRHPTFKPTYLMVADRRPYIVERDSGRYAENANYVNLLLSSTIWDENSRCHGMPPQPEPDFRHFSWRVGAGSTPLNFETFARPLCSFASIGGVMLQAAAIMGASRIGLVGIDMMTSKTGWLHFYPPANEQETQAGAQFQKDGTLGPPATMRRFEEAKRELDRRGIQVFNLSPVTCSPMVEVFGNYPYRRFINEM